jgi:hypothetical protein
LLKLLNKKSKIKKSIEISLTKKKILCLARITSQVKFNGKLPKTKRNSPGHLYIYSRIWGKIQGNGILEA